ncbi:morphogenetic protein [Superficieibacter sp. BNK-5]|jgi:hypothetical protein|uniref:morphogenetic protein n=1 Tax=Superficieibacter sp. BNK-5 TaxID=3376142 RepID=UPI00290173C6|nr:morphogenetic protein [Enterobacteriaceae bacterium]
MKERGMIFNAEMVRAILDGRKTQTRRPVKFPLIDKNMGCELAGNELAGELAAGNYWNSPFGKPGDRIWVRETFRVMGCATDVARLMYKASERSSFTESARTVPVSSCTKQPSQKWTPSIHMPRWASRILLEITNVRVERLQDISHQDAVVEGMPPSHPSIDAVSKGLGYPDFPRSAFAQIWQSIYGAESWQVNPWVWVIEFKRVDGGQRDLS